MSKLCCRCNGTREYLGSGMMIKDCELCLEKDELPTLDKIDRTTKSYKATIKSLMQADPKLTKSGAVKLFDELYYKV